MGRGRKQDIHLHFYEDLQEIMNFDSGVNDRCQEIEGPESWIMSATDQSETLGETEKGKLSFHVLGKPTL